MAEPYDLIVLGAGPAGARAAIEATRHGLSTLLIDEATRPGGQVYRAPADGLGLDGSNPDLAAGERLRADVAKSAAVCAFGHRVWMVAPGFEVQTVGPSGAERHSAPKLIVATGAVERVIGFPGWTTPGVIGLAAATILLKSQGVLPGERTVVAGCGPLLAAVAHAILKSGGQVAAVVDGAGRADWATAMPGLLARPDLLRRGLGWMRQIRSAGIPVLRRQVVTGVTGGDRVRAVRVAPVRGDGSAGAEEGARWIDADALTVGHGLVPSTEVTRMLGASHRFSAERGGWIVERGEDGSTSVPGLYVAGDGAGISGAAAAELEGRLAAMAAAGVKGGTVGERRELRRARRAGHAMARLMAMRPPQLHTVTPETIVCRCEDVTRAEIEDALDAGAADLNQVKAWTRCGMGPCQGRSCGEMVAGLVARRLGSREAAGHWTARPPLRPVPMSALVGAFSYADIPLPKPGQ